MKNCPKCVSLKQLLESKNIEFEEINDSKEIMMIGSKHRIMSAPIIEHNDKYYTYEQFLTTI